VFRQSNNFFSALDDSDDEAPPKIQVAKKVEATVKPSAKAPAAKAPVAEPSKAPQKPRRNDDRNTKHGRGAGRSGGRGAPQDGKREFDRRSGTGRGREIKKGGDGARNWGSDKNEARTAQGPVVEGDEKLVVAEGDAEAAPEFEAAPEVVEEVPEPEDNTISYEDYLKSKEAARTNELLKPKDERQVEDEFSGKQAKKFEEEDFLVMGGAKPQRKREKTKEKKTLEVNIRVASAEQGGDRRDDAGGRGGRGRGAGRGRGEGRGELYSLVL
jgi:plasminogen activator inhibitor 1 RNA-binding protein